MRLDYIPFLKSALLTPLLRKGKEGVDEVSLTSLGLFCFISPLGHPDSGFLWIVQGRLHRNIERAPVQV
jgi:hypothetical protein